MRAPMCSMPGCDHARTVPDDETPEQRQENGARWVGAGGTAVCVCHDALSVLEQFSGVPMRIEGWPVLPPEQFPCDERHVVKRWGGRQEHFLVNVHGRRVCVCSCPDCDIAGGSCASCECYLHPEQWTPERSAEIAARGLRPSPELIPLLPRLLRG